MDVGIQMIFSTYGWPGMSDREAWQEEIRLARLADELGFDVIWSVEHHFFDYSFCPDNTQLLSYLAPLCTHADLGTAAIILPWNDPLRVAEKVSVLDLLSNGRVRLGLGRGLARREFAAFRGTMDDSRERFDEASAMIVEALRTGFIEGHGKLYPQPRIEIRPRPERSFEDRTYAVASSEDSIEAAARLKARMLMFADRPWPARLPGIERYRALYKQFNGVVAAAGGDRRSVRVRGHVGRGERAGRASHGELRRQQPGALRADESRTSPPRRATMPTRRSRNWRGRQGAMGW